MKRAIDAANVIESLLLSDTIHSMKRSVADIVFLACLISGARGQIVEVGPDGKGGPPTSNAEYCLQVERIQPNLKLTAETRVQGRITDQTTAAFRDSPIELRRFISQTKQVIEKKVSTDGWGNYDLGMVKPGEYRLLLSPNRAFQQPEKLECGSKNCILDSVLIANSTDRFTGKCPIR